MGEVEGQPMTLNPLTDQLLGDYDVTVDITSSMRPNKEKKKKDLVDFIMLMLNPAVQQLLMSGGLILDANFLKKSVSEFGYNPEVVFSQAPAPPEMAGGMPGEMPMEQGPAPTPMEMVMEEQRASNAGNAVPSY